MTSFTASYDRQADVLYVVVDPAAPSEGAMSDQSGLTLDFDLATGAASGVTLIGFRLHGWNRRLSRLAQHVADHLSLDPARLVDLVCAAVSSNGDCEAARLEDSGHVTALARPARQPTAARNA